MTERSKQITEISAQEIILNAFESGGKKSQA